MAKIIWLGNELILMMDSNFFHRHGTTIGGVSIEGKDDDDIMHANNFNQGGVLHSTVAFGYLSHPRVSLLCPDSATQEGVNMATVCVLLLFKMHYYHLLWCTCVQLASSSSGVSFLESVGSLSWPHFGATQAP